LILKFDGQANVKDQYLNLIEKVEDTLKQELLQQINQEK